jgi:hypothetical protein
MSRKNERLSRRAHDYGVRIAVLEERWRGAAVRDDDFRYYAEKRWNDLNGEAGRLKTVLDNSVPLTTFTNYVNTQRDKADASEHAQREHFDAYVNSQTLKQDEYHRTQSAAFKTYADEMARWRSSINVRLAGWAGALTVVLAVLEFLLRR